MKLSVIIPVYKVEHTLDHCVESVLGQTVPDMEVILVDDGSPDHCPALCDEWARKDSRISVIHKKNGGLSDARNAGIAVAKGDYITFVDSDDYLLPDTYPPLLDFMTDNQDVDMLEYIIHIDNDKQHRTSTENRIYDSPTDYWLSTRSWLHAYAVNKIYKRSLFDTCRYPIGRTFEDLLLLPFILRKCSKVATINHGTYIYTVNNSGISKQVNTKSICSLLRAEAKAAWVMRTMPWSKNGSNLYYYMCCRIYDLLRLSLHIKV